MALSVRYKSCFQHVQLMNDLISNRISRLINYNQLDLAYFGIIIIIIIWTMISDLCDSRTPAYMNIVNIF